MERRTIEIRGIVQGVGFRPFVFNLACRYHLGGFVQNLQGTVLVEVEGQESVLDEFLAELQTHPPPLAHIESLTWRVQSPRGLTHFRIEASDSSHTDAIFISPDIGVCADCLRELFDPADRRYHYPFLNCTGCGPRLTIITGSPYDRSQTTMASFPMCASCRAEYDDPDNRRFHAQPTACPCCGPQLSLLDAGGTLLETMDPLETFAGELLRGQIGAIKGLGGYHLACDARDEIAVGELRRRKHRDEKPFAVMAANIEAAAQLCHLNVMERELLGSPQAPIVIARKKEGVPLANLAPGNPNLGVMLPYTPLHYLLSEATGGIPLVMTSGNRSDEPIAYRDDAVEKLAGIADIYLTHNRPIQVRCDDSVVRVVDGSVLPIRRSRGLAPRPVPLPGECPRPLLAVGGQLKSTFALAHGRHAFLSHHLGDLDHFEAFCAFQRDLTLYRQLLKIEPEVLVHDLHPDYASTRFALEHASRSGTAVRGVQHHHAHMASCMAENGLVGSAIGVSFDGTGYGTDGAIWGGEFLIGGYRDFRRALHLRYVGMPGGEKAIREPWRMALAHAIDAGCAGSRSRLGITASEESVVRLMLEKGLNCQNTSSVGRLFDAVAALAGVRTRSSYEGQPAVELESLAAGVPDDGHYPFEIAVSRNKDGQVQRVLDTRPMIRAIVEESEAGVEPRVLARRFHTTVVEMIVRVCGELRKDCGLNRVVLSGGVFLNALLTAEVRPRLEQDGFEVFRHRLVPPNDGGLSLGQIAVAMAMDEADRSSQLT